MYTNPNPEQPILLTPGPVMLSPTVKRAAVDTVVCHREPAFSKLYERTANNLRHIAHATSEYETLLLTGSGTAANEAVISSIAGLGKLLILINGEFGERLHYLAKFYNSAPYALHFGWNKPIDLALVEEKIASGTFAAVAMVHHETSTGMLNPVADVGRMTKKYGCTLFVDAVSSLGADNIQVTEWGIDILSSSSGKALRAMPGIGVVIARTSILENISQQPPVTHYLNLANYYKMALSKKQTPNTPAVNLMAALQISTAELLADDAQKITPRAQYFRDAVQRQGFSFFDHGKGHTSSALTCVILPAQTTFKEIAGMLQKENIVVYDGKGPLQNRIMQVGHLGFFPPGQYEAAVGKILDVLSTAVGSSRNKEIQKTSSSGY